MGERENGEALDYNLPGRLQGTTTAGGTKGKIKKVTLNLVQGLPYGLLSRYCSLTTNDQQKQKQQNNTKGRSWIPYGPPGQNDDALFIDGEKREIIKVGLRDSKMTKKKNAGTPLLPHSLRQRHTFCDLIICKPPQKQVKNRSKNTSTCSPKQFHKGSRAPFCSCRSVANFFYICANFFWGWQQSKKIKL